MNAMTLRALTMAIALSMSAGPALAQEMDHSRMKMPPAAAPAKKPVVKKPVAKKPAAKKPAATPAKVDPHAGHAMPASAPAAAKKPAARKPATKPAQPDPHAGHVMPASAPVPAKQTAAKKPAAKKPAAKRTVPASKPTIEAIDHAAMGHAPAAQEPAGTVDHAAMGHGTPMPQEAAQTMDHAAMGHDMPIPSDQPRTPIPPLTDADRIAAFPDVAGHAVHDNAIHSYWLVDRLEGWNADPGTGVGWEALAWIGTDLDRVWLRSEGERVDGSLESADIEVLYGRSVAPWWDVVAGVRHDFGEGPSQSFAAIGVMGLSPYKFEVEATAYVGQSGQTGARLEAEYDTLLTNRLILQWQAEAELYGKDDAPRGIGSGLSTIEAGLRLRYEFTRQFAPYVGIVRERAFGGTAESRRDRFDDIDDTRVVAGLRIWF
jgi:copper resistance protein B